MQSLATAYLLQCEARVRLVGEASGFQGILELLPGETHTGQGNVVSGVRIFSSFVASTHLLSEAAALEPQFLQLRYERICFS